MVSEIVLLILIEFAILITLMNQIVQLNYVF